MTVLFDSSVWIEYWKGGGYADAAAQYIDRNHPDVYAKYGKTKAVHTPLVIEREGQPSRWVTLRALNVLKRVNEAS